MAEKTSTPEKSVQLLKENRLQLDLSTEEGKKNRSDLAPEDQDFLNGLFAGAGTEPEEIAPDVVFEEDVVEEEPEELPAEPGAVLQPGQRAAEAPETSMFRPGEDGDLKKEKPLQIQQTFASYFLN